MRKVEAASLRDQGSSPGGIGLQSRRLWWVEKMKRVVRVILFAKSSICSFTLRCLVFAHDFFVQPGIKNEVILPYRVTYSSETASPISALALLPLF